MCCQYLTDVVLGSVWVEKRRIFEKMKEEGTGRMKKITQLGVLGGTWITRKGDKKYVQNVSRKPGCRLKDNTETHLKIKGSKSVDCIQVIQARF
jgi:hypothetical protein